MASTVVTARMTRRELGIVAHFAGIERATVAEITRYAYLRYLGESHRDAQQHVLATRNSPFGDTENDTVVKDIPVRLPAEIVQAAKEKTPDLNTATMHRYILALATTQDEDEALALATRKPGRPPRKTVATTNM
jgi:hypothetical protein